MKNIGLIFAIKEELYAFKKYVTIKKEFSLFDLTIYEGSIYNLNIILVECGVGKVNAARTTQILIDNIKIDLIINVGIAGSISEKLNVGDIVIGDKLVQHDFDITAFKHDKGYIPNVGSFISSNEKLVNVSKEVAKQFSSFNIICGTIASGDIFCTEFLMGQKISSKFNALCVEMEGAAIAQVCYLSNIPFLVIRSISDSPNNNNVVTYEEFLEFSCNNVTLFVKKILEFLLNK